MFEIRCLYCSFTTTLRGGIFGLSLASWEAVSKWEVSIPGNCCYCDMVLGQLCRVTAGNAHMKCCWGGPSHVLPLLGSLAGEDSTTTELRASLSELFLLGFLLSWPKELGLPSFISAPTSPPCTPPEPPQLTLVGEKRKRIFRKCIRVQIRKITWLESQFSHFADREQMFVIHYWSGRFFGKS